MRLARQIASVYLWSTFERSMVSTDLLHRYIEGAFLCKKIGRLIRIAARLHERASDGVLYQLWLRPSLLIIGGVTLIPFELANSLSASVQKSPPQERLFVARDSRSNAVSLDDSESFDGVPREP